jgi:hypothetical protein
MQMNNLVNKTSSGAFIFQCFYLKSELLIENLSQQQGHWLASPNVTMSQPANQTNHSTKELTPQKVASVV